MDALLVGKHWIHSHEEDTPTEMVFRPADYKFPRSRGRSGFQLNADGTALTSGPGPTDAPQQTAAQWTERDGSLQLVTPSTQETQSYKIVSSTPDRLVVSRNAGQ